MGLQRFFKRAAVRVAKARPRITALSVMLFVLLASAVPVYAAELPAFIGEAVDMLRILVFAIGGGLGLWGIINLLEGYGKSMLVETVSPRRVPPFGSNVTFTVGVGVGLYKLHLLTSAFIYHNVIKDQNTPLTLRQC